MNHKLIPEQRLEQQLRKQQSIREQIDKNMQTDLNKALEQFVDISETAEKTDLS
jgi:hypothetical protein